MKTVFLAVCFGTIFAMTSTAQVHIAATAAVSSNLGYSGGAFGGEVGITKRFFTGDVGIESTEKTGGGTGYAVRGRQSFRYRRGQAFVGAELQESYYSVERYSKTNLFVGASVGTVKGNATYSVRAMHGMVQRPVTPYPNHLNFVEVSAEYFLPKHHIYVRPSLAISRSKSYPQVGVYEHTAFTFRIAVGYWKGF